MKVNCVLGSSEQVVIGLTPSAMYYSCITGNLSPAVKRPL